MKSLKLLIGDPAKAGDSFGVIGLEGTYPEKKIYIRHGIEFKRESYNTVANHFGKMHKKIHFDMMILEKNFDYDNVSKAFAHLPITYVTTGSGLTEETRAKGWAVDKPYMIGWLKIEYKNHTIQCPVQQSSGIKELINQRNEICNVNGSFKRMRSRHDDLFMSELIGANAIRIWWDQQQ